MAWAVSANPQQYEEARNWFLGRVVVAAEDAAAMSDRAKANGFWVGAGLQLTQVQRVFDELGKALENSEPFETFRARMRDVLTDPVHAEVVFRNATQRAYNSGRWIEMQEETVKEFRPFWMFDAILDSRTTKDICAPRDGTLLEADDPWWDTNWAPLHHQCRSSIRNLRREEAERRGGVKRANAEPVDGGFGQSPRQGAAPPPPPPPPDSGTQTKPRRPKPAPAPIKPKSEKTDTALMVAAEKKAATQPKLKTKKSAKAVAGRQARREDIEQFLTAADACKRLAEVLDWSRPDDIRRVARAIIHYVLPEMASRDLAEFTKLPNAIGINAGLGSSAAVHYRAAGNVEVSPAVATSAIQWREQALRGLKEPTTTTEQVADDDRWGAIGAIIHEEIHGMSPIGVMDSRAGYASSNIEEVCTEVLARKVVRTITNELYGRNLPAVAKSGALFGEQGQLPSRRDGWRPYDEIIFDAMGALGGDTELLEKTAEFLRRPETAKTTYLGGQFDLFLASLPEGKRETAKVYLRRVWKSDVH